MKFLLVDDDPRFLTLLETLLGTLGQCDTAVDGNEAINKFHLALEDAAPYDLVCLDIMMPKADGYEVLDQLRQLESEYGIHDATAAKVIMTTALNDAESHQQSFSRGCQGYFAKPIDTREFVKSVKAMLSISSEGSEGPATQTTQTTAKTAPRSEAPRDKQEVKVGHKNRGGDSMRFLIVDDDPVCRTMLVSMFSPFATCDQVFDGQEAIDAFRLALDDESPYDLVCLDIMMPKVNGHEALRVMRKLEKERGIHEADQAKVVMTTALTDAKERLKAFDEGCQSYFSKPLEEAPLLQEIRNLLGNLVPLAEDSDDTTAAFGENPEPIGHQPRFLIVDDDKLCCALLGAILSPYGQCTFAYDGREAIDAVRLSLEDGNPYDLVCLDIMMPGTSGHDALTGIRRLEEKHKIFGSDGVQVIMTTALRDSKHCIQSFKEGCECFVTKPIDQGELMGKIRELGILPDHVNA